MAKIALATLLFAATVLPLHPPAPSARTAISDCTIHHLHIGHRGRGRHINHWIACAR